LKNTTAAATKRYTPERMPETMSNSDAIHATQDTAPPLVQVHNLHKHFGKLHVLKGIDLTLSKGETLVIVGPSGSGKSTLLRCINHLDVPSGGVIMVDDQQIGFDLVRGRLLPLSRTQIARQRRIIGMVFQHFNLYPHLTVLENVIEAPVYVHGQPRAEAQEYALALLERVGLSDKAHAWPAQLSGGQQQRVAIARALAIRPKIILFDEPTSALDPELVGEVLDTMRQLAQEGLTMMIVTHEIGFARDVADRVAVMAEGQVIEIGTPAEVIDNPQHARTQEFFRRFRGG